MRYKCMKCLHIWENNDFVPNYCPKCESYDIQDMRSTWHLDVNPYDLEQVHRLAKKITYPLPHFDPKRASLLRFTERGKPNVYIFI